MNPAAHWMFGFVTGLIVGALVGLAVACFLQWKYSRASHSARASNE